MYHVDYLNHVLQSIGFVAELQSKYANTVSNIMRTTEKLRPSSSFDPASVELPDDDNDEPVRSAAKLVDLEEEPSHATPLPVVALPRLVTATPAPPQLAAVCALCGRYVIVHLYIESWSMHLILLMTQCIDRLWQRWIPHTAMVAL